MPKEMMYLRFCCTSVLDQFYCDMLDVSNKVYTTTMKFNFPSDMHSEWVCWQFKARVQPPDMLCQPFSARIHVEHFSVTGLQNLFSASDRE